MFDVGDPGRIPWVDEPSCGSCHSKRRPNFQFEEPGKLYRNSRGHGGVYCSACHGSPHAITPTVTDADNKQAIMQQGFAGTIKKCTVCHTTTPHDPFPHKLSVRGLKTIKLIIINQHAELGFEIFSCFISIPLNRVVAPFERSVAKLA